MLTLVGENARSECKLFVDFESSFQRNVIAVVGYSLYNSLFIVVPNRRIIAGFFATSRNGSVVFLVENVTEENVIPICIDVA